MARNKYPEQTIENIITVSAKLFEEKGYDKTSVQDIIDALGLSKGGIYHHFNSKEEILDAVIERRSSLAMEIMESMIQKTHAKNAKEKLSKILMQIFADPEIQAINETLNGQAKNPQFVVAIIHDTVNKDATFITKILEDGIKDGSITTEYPTECAEVFMMLLNVWINACFFKRSTSEIIKRLKFVQYMMRQLGVDIMSEELIGNLAKYFAQ